MADKRIKDLPAFSGTVPNNAVFAMETNAATQKVDLSALRAAIGPVGSKRITENGEYTAADDNLYGFNEVEVDVQGTGGRVTQGADGKLLLSEDGSIVAEVPLSVSQNGNYTPSSGYAYSEVEVDVSGGSATLTTKTITANGTYNASSDNADGYSQVVANVPNTYSASDEGKVVNNGALVSQSGLSVNSNGTYDTTLKNSVVVAVPSSSITVESLSVTANNTYTAPTGKAYSPVTVNVPNSYSAADEGKVVSSGALVAQTSKNISANGTYTTTTNNQVAVAVPNTYASGDEGKVVSNGALVSQTSKNINSNGTYSTTTNNQVVVAVPNTYTSGDEGKVVSSGALVSQSSLSVTENGTYNTTLKNSVVVNVPASGVNIPVSMAVTTQPTKTTYAVGEMLNLSGIAVTATYADGTTGNVTSGCTFSPANGTTLSTAGTQTITATYSITDTSSGHNYTVTVTATTSVTVSSSVNSVKAKLGSSSNVVTLSGYYGPMGNYANDYVVPVDSNNADVTVNATQPFEIKCTFKTSQQFIANYPAYIFGADDTYDNLPYVVIYYINDLYYVDMRAFYIGTGMAIEHRDARISGSGISVPLNTDVEIVVSYDGTDVTGSVTVGANTYSDTIDNITLFPQTSAYCLFGTQGTNNQYALAGNSGAYLNIDKCYIKQNGTLIWGVPQS